VHDARISPHVFVAALCVGIACANVARVSLLGALLGTGVLAVVVAAKERAPHPTLVLAALVLTGWWWGSARLDALDRSVLLPRVDTSERSLLVVTGPARSSRFAVRVPAEVHRFGRLRLRESVLLELPLGRSPPQGGLIEAVTTVTFAEQGGKTKLTLHARAVALVAAAAPMLEGMQAGWTQSLERLDALVASGDQPAMPG